MPASMRGPQSLQYLTRIHLRHIFSSTLFNILLARIPSRSASCGRPHSASQRFNVVEIMAARVRHSLSPYSSFEMAACIDAQHFAN